MSDAVNITQPLVKGGAQPAFNMLASAPGPLVRAGDYLRLNATTTDATGVLALNGRMLTLAGEVVPFALSLTFSGTGNQTSVAVPLADGWIIGFSVFVASGTITDGEVQASVQVVQGIGTPATPVMTLASGEVTNIRELGLGAFTASIASGGGGASGAETLVTVVGSDPAAGAQFSLTVTAGQIWRVYAVRANLVTDANVANRNVYIIIDDGTNEVMRLAWVDTQPASTTYAYSWCNVGQTVKVSANSPQIPCPFPVDLGPGWRITSAINAGQAGDNWGAPILTYVQYTA